MKPPRLLVASALFTAVITLTGCNSTRERIATEISIAADRIDTSFMDFGGRITSTHQDYDFLMETGGILVQAPILQSDGTFYLPVYADVSGASNITHPPTKYKANIAVREIVVTPDKKDPYRIYVYLKTAAPTESAPSPVTRGRTIGALKGGTYTLEYLNRDTSTVMLGSFTVAN